MKEHAASNAPAESLWQLFVIFLRLGCTSFGGPVAHLGYFREEFVAKRRWLSDSSYSDLVALCQFLPGPASSQVGMALGMSRVGFGGAAMAWLGFTLPSAALLIAFALELSSWSGELASGALHGLKVVAVAVVAQALLGMASAICTDKTRITLTLIAASTALLWLSIWSQVLIILTAAALGWYLFRGQPEVTAEPESKLLSRKTGAVLLVSFFALLLLLPLAQSVWPSQSLALVDAFYRAGSLVFGGGHVVLPLLQAEVVPNGLVSNDAFLAGYGAAQAVPGPLFTFAAFLGASMQSGPTGLEGGIIALLAIFLPSFLLVAGALPFWQYLRQNSAMKAALIGVNCAVVGLLLAAFYQPVWTSAVFQASDFVLVLLAWGALMYWRVPVWLVVILAAVIGGFWPVFFSGY